MPAEHRIEDTEARDYAADAAAATRVRDSLTAERARLGRSAAATYVAAEPQLRGARSSILKGESPQAVFDDQLQLAADNTERDIAYWLVQARSLDAIPFPALLLHARRLNVAIVVARPAQTGVEAGPYAILFAMAEPDQSD